MPNKPIIDIRLFGAEQPWERGQPHPGDLGRSYGIEREEAKQLIYTANRICRKLREKGLSIGKSDHLYISLTHHIEKPIGPNEENQWGGARVVCCYVELAPHQLAIPKEEREDLFIDRIEEALLQVNHDEEDGKKKITETIAEYKQSRSETEIILKQKETGKYLITVSYQICPNDGQSVAFVYFHDKESGTTGKARLCQLQLWSDIIPLCGSIVANTEEITIKPLKSFSADLVTKEYTTPLTLKMAEFSEV